MQQPKKYYKGEKYIYLLMAYILCKQEKEKGNIAMALIGDDNGMKGGQNYWRKIDIREFDNRILLIETKNTNHNAEFSKTYEIIVNRNASKPSICDYVNEAGDNYGQKWIH